MKASLELLHHFNCPSCSHWWSIASRIFAIGNILYCPHCGSRNTINSIDSTGNIGSKKASPLQSQILEEISAERDRQDLKFGANSLKSYPPLKYLLVAAEELGEIAQEIAVNGDEHIEKLIQLIHSCGQVARNYLTQMNSEDLAPNTVSPPENYRTELVQLAAVCVAAVEALDGAVTDNSQTELIKSEPRD